VRVAGLAFLSLLLTSGVAQARWAPSLLDAGDSPTRSDVRFGGEAGLGGGGAFHFSWNSDGLTVPALYVGGSWGEGAAIVVGGGVHRSWINTPRTEARFRIAADAQIALDGGFAFRALPGLSFRFALDPKGRLRFACGVDGRMSGGFGVVEALVVDLGLPVGLELRISKWAQVAIRGRIAVERIAQDPPQAGFEIGIAVLGFAPRIP